MSHVTAQFIEAEQDWQNETTRYWYTLTGTDYGTGVEFDSDEFAVAESGPTDEVLDADGCPLTEGDWRTIAVRKHAVVTDELRLQAAGL